MMRYIKEFFLNKVKPFMKADLFPRASRGKYWWLRLLIYPILYFLLWMLLSIVID